MFLENIKKRIFLTVVACGTIIGLGSFVAWRYFNIEQPVVSVYNKVRDYQDIIDLFELERFWLTSTPDYSPYYMLEYMTPNKKIQYRGMLHIYVARPEEKFAGFTAFYMLDKNTGMILFLATRPEFRGQGYGKLLIKAAIEGLKKLGAKKVNLVTRTTNIPAQKVYVGVGFDEILRDEDGFVYYEYTK